MHGAHRRHEAPSARLASLVLALVDAEGRIAGFHAATSLFGIATQWSHAGWEGNDPLS